MAGNDDVIRLIDHRPEPKPTLARIMDAMVGETAEGARRFPRMPAPLPCVTRDHRDILFEIADVADRAQLMAPLDKGSAKITGTLLARLIEELVATAT